MTRGLQRDDVGLVLPAVALPRLLREASSEQNRIAFAHRVTQIGSEAAPSLGCEPDRFGVVPPLIGAVGRCNGDAKAAVGTGLVPDTGQDRIRSDDALNGEVELTSHEKAPWSWAGGSLPPLHHHRARCTPRVPSGPCSQSPPECR